MILAFAALLVAVASVSLTAAWADWWCRSIPHWPIVVVASGWGVMMFSGPSLAGGSPLASLTCGALVLVAGAVLWRLGWLGAGDVKLAAALALWLGPLDFGLALLAAGVLALILAGTAFAISAEMARRGVPLACALAPSAAVLLVWRAAELLAEPSSAWPVG